MVTTVTRTTGSNTAAFRGRNHIAGREQQPIEVVLMQHISLEQLKPIRKEKSLIIWITL